MEDARYPIGRFDPPRPISFQRIQQAVDAIATLPSELRAAVAGLDEAKLDTRYRDGGWTVRQVVHHLADSHMNAYARMRLAVTEDNPTIKPYDEAAWAELADAKAAPVDLSLVLLDSLHARWVMFLRSLKEAGFRRPLFHPESGDMMLDVVVLLYEWHGRHHVAHIKSLRARSGW
ncbi:MAG: putative metal-dependent hydrolase [Candidatus Krumholzibacteria bacterium]|nr:putative metal-dependent hydrolase [Candidatus Krumholzibacteria bacterium]MDH4337219.1 putative metal-dependent hydrolase [Candidatus Krumholzibacteria bacterium]MDH5268681.1 putative metal-dependent hydrolase [Candidatus Krumholzibacteria bacterium]